MQKWNRRINLISNADDVVVIQQHFLDSLSCALASVIHPPCRLLDIGSGAGFPGIPLKIYYPELHLTAVDAVSKKVMFLRHLCRSLALQHVECVSSRLEPHSVQFSSEMTSRLRSTSDIPVIETSDIPVIERSRDGENFIPLRLEPGYLSPDVLSDGVFDVIVSRAVGTVPLLLSLAAPLLSTTGYVLLQRGKQGPQEFEAYSPLFCEYGLQPIGIHAITFSFLSYPRYLLVLRNGREGAFHKNKA